MDKSCKVEIWLQQGLSLVNNGDMQLYEPLHQHLLNIGFQILAKLRQLKIICNKWVYRTKWYFFNKSNLF